MYVTGDSWPTLSDMQVANDGVEEGKWLLAVVEKLCPGFCWVRYLHLKTTDAEGAPPLREWHPLPEGATKELAAQVKTEHPEQAGLVYPGSAFVARPGPPAHVS